MKASLPKQVRTGRCHIRYLFTSEHLQSRTKELRVGSSKRRSPAWEWQDAREGTTLRISNESSRDSSSNTNPRRGKSPSYQNPRDVCWQTTESSVPGAGTPARSYPLSMATEAGLDHFLFTLSQRAVPSDLSTRAESYSRAVLHEYVPKAHGLWGSGLRGLIRL